MKVLVISHNPVGTQFNMSKTLMSLLSSFNREELCQLYIYPALPDVDKCSSYFRITDKDVLRSYYSFGLNCGEVKADTANHSMYENEKDEKVYKNPKNKDDFRMILRDSMWKYSRWYTKKLEDWINREKPTSIFVAPGDAKFLYDIALKISKKHNLPIVTYICDDYYFVKKPKALITKLRVGFLKKKIEKLMKATSNLIVICEELKNEYSKKFSVKATTVMTGSEFVFTENPQKKENPTVLSYFGNICCNRYTSLADIGRALDKINDKEGTSLKLNIYTAEKNPDIISTFSNIKSVSLCPFISGDAFKSAFLNSELLLHVEAFDEESMDLVKRSISTKISDSLASGIPFVAYGPSGIASIDYLLSEECAMVATSKDELETMLYKAFFDKKARELTVLRAIETAEKYHNNVKNGDLVKQIFLNV